MDQCYFGRPQSKSNGFFLRIIERIVKKADIRRYRGCGKIRLTEQNVDEARSALFAFLLQSIQPFQHSFIRDAVCKLDTIVCCLSFHANFCMLAGLTFDTVPEFLWAALPPSLAVLL